MTDLADGIGLMEWDWCYTARATRLHHASLTAEQYEEFADGQADGRATASCGRGLWLPRVPSVGARLSMPRCARCCDRLGYHRLSVGSPKNDPVIRPLVEARIAHLHTELGKA